MLIIIITYIYTIPRVIVYTEILENYIIRKRLFAVDV